ncbi:hypothetical protein CALCODRAFT_527241 [Calocera cornea HHB12733]|uniref:Uncharacterized protein n=1 Tax=Calocera cornea HHB12733 TaxID=1353952 RepID=A0A165E5I4_9BASI|nr:hypothetical protein CALCODRAFT_527241 [Calocera cornea HHB12733]
MPDVLAYQILGEFLANFPTIFIAADAGLKSLGWQRQSQWQPQSFLLMTTLLHEMAHHVYYRFMILDPVWASGPRLSGDDVSYANWNGATIGEDVATKGESGYYLEGLLWGGVIRHGITYARSANGTTDRFSAEGPEYINIGCIVIHKGKRYFGPQSHRNTVQLLTYHDMTSRFTTMDDFFIDENPVLRVRVSANIWRANIAQQVEIDSGFAVVQGLTDAQIEEVATNIHTRARQSMHFQMVASFSDIQLYCMAISASQHGKAIEGIILTPGLRGA